MAKHILVLEQRGLFISADIPVNAALKQSSKHSLCAATPFAHRITIKPACDKGTCHPFSYRLIITVELVILVIYLALYDLEQDPVVVLAVDRVKLLQDFKRTLGYFLIWQLERVFIQVVLAEVLDELALI